MSDVMREIEDDMRQQRLQAFWIENRAWIVGGVILAIVMTAALSFWRQHTLNKNAMATYELFQAMDKGDEAALSALAADGKGAHGGLAAMLAAGLHAQKGESEAAAALYEKVAGTRGLDRMYRDLAALLAVSQRLDSGEPAALHSALKPLLGEKNVWRYTAMELQALLYAREGKMKEAVDVLATLSTQAQAPAETRARASTLRALYLESASTAPAAER